MKVLIPLIICLFSIGVMAQEAGSEGEVKTSVEEATQTAPELATEEVEPPKDYVELQQIEVTGSFIKRVDEEGPSPIKVIDAKQMEKSAQNSVADVFRESAFTNQDSREDSLSSVPGAATAGIGLFSSERVLVLLDGQRLPEIGGENSVDLNLIPMSAIERVDILKDGASATYGSDAIGGVMNFITKKNFSGGSVSIRQTSTEEGGANRGNAAISFGRKFADGKGSFLGALEYKDNGHLKDSDRDFSRLQNVAAQGSGTSNVALINDLNTGKLTTSQAQCPQGSFDSENGICRFDYTKYSWNLPDNKQASMLLSGSYDINKHIKSKTTGTFVNREINTRLAPPPDQIRMTVAQAAGLGIPNYTPDPLLQGAPVLMNYRLVNEAGPRETLDETNMFNVSQKLYGQIAGSWTWDLSGGYGKSIRRNTGNGYGNKAQITKDILEGKFKPWLADGDPQKGSISPGGIITTHEGQRSDQGNVQLVTTGQIYDGGPLIGPVAWAVGGSLNWQSYSQDVDSVTAVGDNWGGIGSNGEGSRSFQGIFQELSIFPIDTVEVGIATRFDHYSDFGDTFNPKLSVSWQPAENFLVRSSIGTGFRAPNLVDLYNGNGVAYPSLSDAVGDQIHSIPGAGNLQQYRMNTTSDPDLLQERSVFFNLGFVAQPKKNWNFETNYYFARIKDAVGSPPNINTFLIQKELELVQSGQNPADYFRPYGIEIVRAADGRLIEINRPSAFNLPRQDIQGIDFRITNEVKANIGGFPFGIITSVEHTQFLSRRGIDFPGLPIRANRDIDWKNNSSVTFVHKAHFLTVVARSISANQKDANEGLQEGDQGFGQLSAFTAYDLNYRYSKLFGRNIALTVGIKNLQNKNPPIDNTSVFPLNTNLYDPMGRYAFAGIDYTF